MISDRDVIGILVAAALVFASSLAVAQNKNATGSIPNQPGQQQGALIRVEKRTTECLSSALQDMYAKGWRDASLTVAVMDLCPYPGLPVTVDDYAQLVHAQVAQFNRSR